jgi:hypothetical protein
MEMPHAERGKWCEEISRINKNLSEEPTRGRSLI